MSRENDDAFNVARAELFDAMGHPNRIRIIKALAEKPLGFSELKRAVGIESSGLLAFHLDKLTHLVGTDQAGMYALTEEGREALQIIRSTADESNRGNGSRGSTGPIDRRNVILAAVVIGILVLASVAVYQQSELSALQRTNSSQSSELASPTMDVVLSNFTVTKANATAEPVMLLFLSNDGQAPVSSGSFLVGVYEQGNTFQSCYNNSANFFPVYPNDSTVVFSPLSCGNLGDKVVLTAQINFLTSNANMTKVFNAQTTIIQPQFKVSTVAVDQLGIHTFVTPWAMQNQTYYIWYFTLTNESPTPIVSVHATLGSANNPVSEISGCVGIAGNTIFPVSRNTPLTQSKSCNEENSMPVGTVSFSVGQSLDVVVSVTYSNGTASSASTTAVVVPPYVLFQ